MIPTVRFEKSGLQTSRLAFGLSRLHHMPSSDDRQRLLAFAADLGFRHFDAARAYGDGLAEAELGNFLRGRRRDYIVATKYGIPAHPLIERAPFTRTAVAGARLIARKLGWPDKRTPMTGQGLHNSIQQSLRKLGTDMIDILFLHEPAAGMIPKPDELMAEMTRQKAAGNVRFFGLAGAYSSCVQAHRMLGPVIDIVQTYESEWESGALMPDLTFGAMRRGPQSRLEKALDESDAVENLKAALRRRPNGAIIVSSRRHEHLKKLAEISAGDVS